jgi:structural maintenance of chromosome 1
MPSVLAPGRIERLEVENFKSYKGHQVIGPFKGFTAIIGPNGAGKSNLMDAISFVLGVRSMQLRGAQLKDLIYAFDDREREQRGRKAFVKLVYVLGSGEELHFTRTISSNGSSEYRIDNQSVGWDAYNNKMKSLGILVKARNFLVFQVRVCLSVCLSVGLFVHEENCLALICFLTARVRGEFPACLAVDKLNS